MNQHEENVSPHPDTTKNNNADFSSTHRFQELTCRRVSDVKKKGKRRRRSGPRAPTPCHGHAKGPETPEKKLKDKLKEVWRCVCVCVCVWGWGDLSLPADAEQLLGLPVSSQHRLQAGKID